MRTKKNIFIGVDLGGTKIMTGAISADGKILGAPVKVLTGGTDPKEEIVKRITDSIKKIIKDLEINSNEITGIGIGSTGPISIKEGVILECPQLPTMNYFPLRKTLEEYFSVPVFMNNDANCLIYGETIFGAASKNTSVVGFTLGTGIGCAIILNKKILNGATESAGEIWPSPYLNGETIEDYISGKGVSMIYKNLSGENHSSKEIMELARTGDPVALKTWEEFGRHLAVPVSWGINFIDPEAVLLGGSIANARDFFLPSLERHLRKNICPEPAQKTKIVFSELRDHAGFIGAAALVLNEMNFIK